MTRQQQLILRTRNVLISTMPRLAESYEHLRLLKLSFRWREIGLTHPLPGLLKRSLLKAEGRRIGATTFVETGTYLGDTVWFLRRDFKRMYTIEIEQSLFELARRRFSNMKQVRTIHGDSGAVLAKIVDEVHDNCLFWLDGHYSSGITGRGSKDCPVWSELDAITKVQHHYSIMIDDARCFGTDPEYPTIGELQLFVSDRLSSHRLRVENDIIYITPNDRTT